MSNYYTQSSFRVPLVNEHAQFAKSVIECAENENIDFKEAKKSIISKSYPSDVYRLARTFVHSLDEYYPGCVSVEFKVEVEAEHLLFAFDETMSTENAATFVYLILRHFDLNICVGFEAAQTCSKQEVDAFCGHALFITKDDIKSMSTSSWVSEQISNFNQQAA